MRFLLSGASGFVGTYLREFLTSEGHEVAQLVRQPPTNANEVGWDPYAGKLESSAFNDIDVVVNLSGASITGKRWTAAYKRELIDSRVLPTVLLASTLAQLDKPPSVFISFSGAGIYGYAPADKSLDEDSPPGSTYIAELAQQWEAAAQIGGVDVSSANVTGQRPAPPRVVYVRLGVVIGADGMLAKLLPLFRAGLGARLGSGRQAFSWIALDDVGPALLHSIEYELSGPVNFTSPQPVTNAQFTQLLAHAVHRPALLNAPAFVLRTLAGELADELLNGARVIPRRLQDSGYQFGLPALDETLEKYVRQMLELR